MCGIAGVIKFHNPSATRALPRKPAGGTPESSALEAMSAALAHRGPDGSGIWTDPRPHKTAALIHRRLAIIDLPGGAQPMSSEDATGAAGEGGGSVHVVFNGEIYNHAELRRELQAAGHTFKSDHSDTEVLLHGWEQWQTELPAKLRGMFAFAIWDTRPDPRDGIPCDTLFMARDRMGQKPLFYATLEDGLVFGSTIPSILAWPEVPRRVPREQLALYLLLGYIPPPQTIWRDISQVVPGGWVRLRRDILDGGLYWHCTDVRTSAPKISSEGQAKEILRAEIFRAVESQLVADVPIACFLSGGIDSSIIAALMQQTVFRLGGDPIQTVSVGFDETGFDETPFAQQVADRIGSQHTRLQVHAGQDVLPTLHMLMQKSLGQPFADSSILPTYQLSKAVRQIAPVALSGDGADELFAGYDRYRAMMLLERWKTVARLMPRRWPLGSSARKERYRRLAAAFKASSLSERYTRLIEIFPLAQVEALLGEPIDDLAADALPSAAGPSAALQVAMQRDQREYLPGDVLWKVDSASMAHALEVRSPFLDHGVVELANALDPQLLIPRNGRGHGKWVLRQAFADELPPPVRSRGKKGFGVPIGQWFRADLREPLRDLLLGASSRVAGWLNRGVIELLLTEHESNARDHTHRLFALLMLELWAREFHPLIDPS